MSNVVSGERINYSLRPAKSVERKMLKDTFCNLYPFGNVAEYRYIGFGSKYFSDFRLFHRALHIEDMISIESDEDYKEKYEFNKPFDCVKLMMGTSNSILSRLNQEKKFIAWLDYDFTINNTMLVDLEILIENLHSGSVMLQSFNAIPPRITGLRQEFGDKESSHAELLRKKLKDSEVPAELIPLDMPTQRLSKTEVYSSIVKTIFENKIKNSLLNKNSALDDSDKWEYKQLFYFSYKDGAEMCTLGWIFYQNKDRGKVQSCGFEGLEFCNSSDVSYRINIPNLTVKEICFLQEQMPLASGDINRELIPSKIYSDEVVKSFSKIYKYFPSFMDIEIA